MLSRDDWGIPAQRLPGRAHGDFCPTTAGAFALHRVPPTAAAIAAGGKWGGHWGTPGQLRSRLRLAAAVQLRLQHHDQSRDTTAVLQPATRPAAPAARKRATCRRSLAVTGTTSTRATAAVFARAFQYGYAVREGWSGARTAGNWRQGHRQHVLDFVPLLPAVDRNITA